MKIFLVGVLGFTEGSWDYLPVETHDHYLVSYVEFRRKPKDKIIKYFESIPKNCKILLDSGAFSIFTGTKTFELDEYISFLHEYGKYFWNYVELDVIRKDTMTVEESIKLTIQNQKEMEKQGLKPLPVYHAVSTTLPYLNTLLEEYEYVFIGGMAAQGVTTSTLTKLLDGVFNINAKYKRKLHGLGQTNTDICRDYPFCSVDSISWKVGSLYNSSPILKPYLDLKSCPVNKDLFYKELTDPMIFDDDTREKMTNAKHKDIFSFKTYHQWETDLTDVWKERGIIFDKE